MKLLCLILISAMLSCNVRVEHPHTAVFSTVDRLMRTDSSRTGFFTNTSFYDRKYQQIEYETTRGVVFVPNDGTQNILLCRYDTVSLKPIWVQTAGGKGGDGGLNYYTAPTENAVYVVGCFEDTAYFPKNPGSSVCDTVISHGMVDLFIAKYRFTDGALLWVRSGGSIYSDVVFIYGGARHTETYLFLDSASVTVYANFFGPAKFDNKTIEAKPSGSAVQITYGKANGEVSDLRFVTELPSFGKKNDTLGKK